MRVWNTVIELGPRYGFFTNEIKFALLVHGENRIHAKELFANSVLKITTEGLKVLGSAIGQEQFVNDFVINRIDEWISTLSNLEQVAKEHPHVAFIVLTKSLQFRWTFVQRTTCSEDACYDRVSSFIFDRLVPTMIGVDSQLASKYLLSLLLCCGGLGIVDLVAFVSKQYEWSLSICSHLQNGLRMGIL
ncbi:hypothetical protein GJ496_011672 [Pomphorhynchus laevis]|nr:hypothetical protein GJ496_011672 [Pomphorhynchus laevis]